MIWRVRDRATLQELQRRGRPGRSGPVTVRYLPGAAPPRVAFAVGRRVGSAVARNRVRRQLRAASRRLATDAVLTGGALLVTTQPEVTELTFADLTQHLRRALAAAADRERGHHAPA